MKLINGEKATFQTPTFSRKRERTLEMLIKDLYEEYVHDTKMVRKFSYVYICAIVKERVEFKIKIGQESINCKDYNNLFEYIHQIFFYFFAFKDYIVLFVRL